MYFIQGLIALYFNVLKQVNFEYNLLKSWCLKSLTRSLIHYPYIVYGSWVHFIRKSERNEVRKFRHWHKHKHLRHIYVLLSYMYLICFWTDNRSLELKEWKWLHYLKMIIFVPCAVKSSRILLFYHVVTVCVKSVFNSSGEPRKLRSVPSAGEDHQKLILLLISH